VTAGNAGDASVAQDLIADLHDRVEGDKPTVYGDNAYGTGAFQDHLETSNIESRCKTQPPVNTTGLFAKDAFDINLDDDTVTCPAWVTVSIRRNPKGQGTAHFAEACTACPRRGECTTATGGRTISVGIHEPVLGRARDRQTTPDWRDDYRATRPKVERKIGHLMRRQHGGRKARVRGKPKVAADFNLLAAATNLARLAALGLTSTPTGWATTT